MTDDPKPAEDACGILVLALIVVVIWFLIGAAFN